MNIEEILPNIHKLINKQILKEYNLMKIHDSIEYIKILCESEYFKYFIENKINELIKNKILLNTIDIIKQIYSENINYEYELFSVSDDNIYVKLNKMNNYELNENCKKSFSKCIYNYKINKININDNILLFNNFNIYSHVKLHEYYLKHICYIIYFFYNNVNNSIELNIIEQLDINLVLYHNPREYISYNNDALKNKIILYQNNKFGNIAGLSLYEQYIYVTKINDFCGLLIHEIIHSIKYDTYNTKFFINDILFNNNEYEIFTNTYATIYNIIFNVLFINKISQINIFDLFKELYIIELGHSLKLTSFIFNIQNNFSSLNSINYNNFNKLKKHNVLFIKNNNEIKIDFYDYVYIRIIFLLLFECIFLCFEKNMLLPKIENLQIDFYNYFNANKNETFDFLNEYIFKIYVLKDIINIDYFCIEPYYIVHNDKKYKLQYKNENINEQYHIHKCSKLRYVDN
jgi:hypothetical protein